MAPNVDGFRTYSIVRYTFLICKHACLPKELFACMTASTSTNRLVDTLEQHDDVVTWINEVLVVNQAEGPDSILELSDLDHQITQMLSIVDISSEDTSNQVERIIEDVSRGIPRLAYDLHFMKDGASTLQSALIALLRRSRDAAPKESSAALDTLHQLDTIKGRMEAARDVLREAESWSTLEHEVTSLVAEKSYTKAAERLSEANKSMVVFQNTAEYDLRRTLLVNLQNQLEAALSTALISAINAQDSIACKNYFSIFSIIERESEFRNYYYASRRSSIVSLWQAAILSDCGIRGNDETSFINFLPVFFSDFLSLLESEKSSICAIFPDPALTVSQFISSILSSLQPTMAQRLTLFSAHYGELVLPNLISILRATEEFATGVENIVEKVKLCASPLLSSISSWPDRAQSHRRRSSRMSISLRPGQHRVLNLKESLEISEWDQELFQPFLDFQADYGSLERRYLEQSLHTIITNDTRDAIHIADRPRLFKERSVDIFGMAERSMDRCKTFTHGYGAVGLLHALDAFFQYFIDMWNADLELESHSSPHIQNSISETELSDLDYTTQDWFHIQLSLDLLASAKSSYDRLSSFETKIRTYLCQVAAHFRSATNDPFNFQIAATKGESQLLEQSALNSAELHGLLLSAENESVNRDPPFTASLRHQPPTPIIPTESLLINAGKSISNLARTCQSSMTKTILSPLRKHLVSYPSLPAWRSTADINVAISSNDLKVPTFSLSPTEIMQRVAEGLLNLPRLFEIYADDDALAFSLDTLPFIDDDILKAPTEQMQDAVQTSSWRGSSNYTKPVVIDAETVTSAWLITLGHTLLDHLTSDILPTIPALTNSGAAQLFSDLEYVSNIVRALNVEHTSLEKWKTYVGISKEDGLKLIAESGPGSLESVLETVSKLRGWR